MNSLIGTKRNKIKMNLIQPHPLFKFIWKMLERGYIPEICNFHFINLGNIFFLNIMKKNQVPPPKRLFWTFFFAKL